MEDTQVRWGCVRAAAIDSMQRARVGLSAELADWRTLLVSLGTRDGGRALWRAVRPLVLFAVAYLLAWSYLFVSAFLGAQPPPAPLFPPGAVLLCALILTPPRRWWLYLAVAFVIQVPVLAYLHLPLAWNLLGVVPDALEPIVAVGLMRLVMAVPPRFASLREVSLYTACVVAGVAAGATVGSAINAGLGHEPYGSAWRTWFLSDTLANLVLAPMLLLWLEAGIAGLRAGSRWRYVEAGALYGALVLLGALAFDTQLLGPGISDAVLYLPVPLLLWAAVRFGPRGVASALSLLVLFAIPAVANGTGPFAAHAVPDQTLLGRVFEIQLFLLVIGVPLFFLAALVQERAAARIEAEHQTAQLQATFEAMADGVAVYDAQGNLVQENTAQRRLLGLEAAPTDYADLPLTERMALFAARDATGRVLGPDEGPLPRVLQGKVLTGTEAQDIQSRTLDGREVALSVSAAPLRDGEGRLTGAVAIFHDQTERRRLEHEREEALARAQARSAELEAVFGAMTDGVVVYDPSGRITYTNAAFRDMFVLGLRPDYTQLPLAERAALVRFRTPDGQMLPVDQLPQARVLRGEVLTTGAAAGVDRTTADLVEDALDGRVLTVNAAGSPLRDAGGGITGAVLVFRDVTEERHLQHTTRELAVQLQAILDAMSDAVFLYGIDGRVLRLNAAAQALVQEGPDILSVAGTAWWEQVRRYDPRRPDGRPLSLEEWPLVRVLRGETLTSVEVEDVVLTDAYGHDRVLNYIGGPACDAVGKLMGYVFVVRDVTERRRLQHEWEEARANEGALREVNERLDTFVAMAAHDLRSPVGVSRMVVTRAQQLLGLATEAGASSASSTPEKQTRAIIQAVQAIEMTEHNLNRLWRLVQQLLDASRVKQGTLVLQCQPVNLVELVRASVAEQCLLNPSRVIVAELPEADAPPVVVDADPDRLTQVLTNYLTNAVRYSPEEQPIEVSLSVEEPATEESARRVMRVTVRDHGPGIAPEEQATIWERFQRARSMQEAKGGLGLGLYIARTLIEQHGGQVGVDSVVGQGSAFWFSLPTTAAVQRRRSARPRRQQPSPTRREHTAY